MYVIGGFDRVYKTRYKQLGFVRWAGDWRFVDISAPRADGDPPLIGSFYKSKAELLADLPAYAEMFGATLA